MDLPNLLCYKFSFMEENKIILYKDEEGKVNVNVRFADEDVWLTQAQLAEIYNTTQQNISLHQKGIYADGELDEEATHKKYLLVRQEGKRQYLTQRGQALLCHDVLKEKRAEYGEQIIENLAIRLTIKYGKGFIKRNLHHFVDFFVKHPDFFYVMSGDSKIVNAVSSQLPATNNNMTQRSQALLCH